MTNWDATIIASQTAIIAQQAEEIALLKGTIASQDEREKKAGERCGVPYEQHGCDWPDWMAEKVLSQAARIAELEALGPLIEEYGKQLMFFGMHGDKRYQHLANEVLSLAKTILKGGA